MTNLYDTNKELFFDDYKPIDNLIKGMNTTELLSLLDNLENAIDNAFSYHSELLTMSLYDDIVLLKQRILFINIQAMSSGTVAGIIGNTKYNQIDKAINKTLSFLFNTEPENIFPLKTDYEGITSLIKECYKNNSL